MSRNGHEWGWGEKPGRKPNKRYVPISRLPVEKKAMSMSNEKNTTQKKQMLSKDDKVKDVWETRFALVADGREQTENHLFMFSLQDAPLTLKRALMSASKRTFEDGDEGMSELIQASDEHEEDDEEQEVNLLDNYISSKLITENTFKLPLKGKNIYCSIALNSMS